MASRLTLTIGPAGPGWGPQTPVQFSWPQDGVPGRDRRFNNYVDLDPTPGIRDWNRGRAAYDGHDGLDFGATNYAQMDEGINILAAAPGTVVATQNGNFDRNRGTLGNIIVGDVVQRGDPLGLEGSSGHSTASHLHFEVQHNFLAVETFLERKPADHR